MADYEENESVQRDPEPAEEPERISGEYHFERPEERSAYSDAGYVPSADAAAVPKSYHCTAPTEKKEKKQKAPRRGMPALAVIALCLVCALLGGLAAGFAPRLFAQDPPTESAAEASSTVINRVAAQTTPVTTKVVSSGSELSATQIYYDLALNQVVGVTTEITYTNFWGYTSSGAVSGSGFIISENGYVLTNYHVIEDAVKGGYDVSVLTFDGTEYTAAVVGYEEDNDVAVLKIEAEGLSPATIGDSDTMQVGQTVYAVGNPLGELQYTMTDGMVSALDREITSYEADTGSYKSINMFQISAAINSGNSGGPIYNSRGEVIGIATAKYSDTGVESLGFAIPINDAIKIANDLITDGYVRGKAYLGVGVRTVSASAVQYYNMVAGAYVASVTEGSCAETAGIQVNDIIVALDDTEITSMGDLTNAKKDYRAGDTAVLKVYRNGEYLELPVTFDEETPEAVADVEEEDGTAPGNDRQQNPENGGGYGDYGGFGGYGDFFDYFFGSNPFGGR